jgi:hypothetical protein
MPQLNARYCARRRAFQKPLREVQDGVHCQRYFPSAKGASETHPFGWILKVKDGNEPATHFLLVSASNMKDLFHISD